MIEYEKTDGIPKIEGTFKPKEETRELATILSGLSPGEALRFPVSGNQPVYERKLETQRLRARMTSAIKMSPGRFKAAIREGDVYVERLD